MSDMHIIPGACPFCGSRDLDIRPLWNSTRFFVACRSCRAAGPAGRSRDEACALFGRRARPQGQGGEGR